MVAAVEAGYYAIAELQGSPRGAVGGRVRELFEDIRHTLRVPQLGMLFRLSANFPEELERLWLAVREASSYPAFERSADEIRSLSVLPDAAAGPEASAGAGVRALTETAHYALPKLLLIATVWHLGPAPGGASAALKRELPLPRGIAHGTATAPLIDPACADHDLASLLQEIRVRHAHPAVASYYRALANWPDVLATLWAVVRPHVGGPSYRRRREELVEAARRRAEKLRLVGGKPPRDPLAGVLACLRTRLIPELLIDVALVRAALDGVEAARHSAHSVR